MCLQRSRGCPRQQKGVGHVGACREDEVLEWSSKVVTSDLSETFQPPNTFRLAKTEGKGQKSKVDDGASSRRSKVDVGVGV